jgi:hypothetical protein
MLGDDYRLYKNRSTYRVAEKLVMKPFTELLGAAPLQKSPLQAQTRSTAPGTASLMSLHFPAAGPKSVSLRQVLNERI